MLIGQAEWTSPAGEQRHGKSRHRVNETRNVLEPGHLRIYVAELPKQYNIEPLEALLKLGSAVRCRSSAADTRSCCS